MKDPSPAELDAAVLDFINPLREQLGIGPPLDKLPPDGHAGGFVCPIAQALGCDGAFGTSAVKYVGVGYITLRDGGFVELPSAVSVWIANHDARDRDRTKERAMAGGL